jgi:hypothetical protein
MLAVAVLAATTLWPRESPADAIVGGDRPTTTGVVSVVVTQPGTTIPGSPGDETGATAPVRCTWTPVPATPDQAAQYNEITELLYTVINNVLTVDLEITITYYSDDGALHAWSDTRAQFEVREEADCTDATVTNGVTTGDERWTAVRPPSPTILLPGVVERATEPIDAPSPSINPPAGSAINLGMWLAVEPLGPIAVRAQLGPLWAEATATLASTSFDLGNGDEPVTCAGHGTPIPESRRNSIDEGPCGYTFRDLDDIGDTEIAINSNWTVTWILSDGRTGSSPGVTTGVAIPYEVYEVQTVGTRG